ncbi:MAG: NPCBM/NEW2 domain-containing protein [Solibacillus sp.]
MKVIKIATAAAMALSLAGAPINVLASPFQEKKVITASVGKTTLQANTARVSKFNLYGNDLLNTYNEVFKMDNTNIASITNNGGNYPGSPLGQAIDGDMNTHWETNRDNKATFTNEVNFTFNEITSLDRIVYAARQISAKGKGFAQQFEIYSSNTDEGDNYTLVSSGEYTGSTGDIVEIQFTPTEFKRLKFVFTKANQNWASAAEFQFYKEDQVSNNMKNLFTDDTFSAVSKEFNTLEALHQLETEVNDHPLYPLFKEDIENAKAILNQNEVQTTTAATKTFDLYSNEKYSKLFKMGSENILSIRNNAGHWSSAVIGNAIDGNLDTYWETNRGNSTQFTNEVELEFKDAVKLNRIIYGARNSDRKGFAEEFEIYGSQTSKGDTYRLVATGKHNVITGLVEAKFEPTTFKRVKFKFNKSTQNWASLAEIAFYKEDTLAGQISNIFTDGTMSELVPQYNNVQAINELDAKAKNHPLYSTLKAQLEIAKNIIANPTDIKNSVWSLESRGDSIKESQKRRVWNFQDWQPTGLAVKSGQEINVFVDVASGEPTPKLVFKQMESQHNGNVDIPLSPGMNKIIVPERPDDEIKPGVAKAGVLYTVNPYTSNEQSRAPKIRVEGAFSYPHFIKGVDNDAEVLKELEEYVELLKVDASLPNVFEVFSDKALVNVEATYALDWFKENNKLPSETADKSDEVLKETMKFWGFDNSSEINSDFDYRYVTMVKHLTGGAFMNANNGITGIRPGQQGGALDVNMGWGFAHEMGHNFDTTNRRIVESSNNILPLHFQRINGVATKITEQNGWDAAILPKVALDDYSQNELYPGDDYMQLSHIAPLWQLQLYDETFYPRFEQGFRSTSFTGGSREQIHQEWVKVSSDVLHFDLTEFFARHGIRASDEVKEYTSKYPKPTKKLWYMNDKVYLDNGEKFTEDVKYSATVSKNSNQVTLNFEMNKENIKNTLGYEIIRDGETIGFTSGNVFVDKNADPDINYSYEISAYDKKLNPAKSVKTNAFTPAISVENYVTLKLHSEFNPMDYVKAFSYKGEDITQDVKIKSNTVDVTKKGNYEVVYEVTNSDLVESKTINVTVTSDFAYISDLTAQSAKVGWGSFQKDKSVSGGTITLIRQGIDATYAKGIGVHANSEVVYDIEGKDFNFFESYIGIDQAMKEKGSSATFEVWVDGEKKFESGVFRSDTEHDFVKIPVTGAKEIKLITTDANNGNGSDHTVWADAKFTQDSSNPTLTITKSTATKVGVPIDLTGQYTAFDAEDGDLTHAVQMTGADQVNFDRVGKYELTYTVTDNDGNETTAKRAISVVDMDDFNYLSNFDWKSTQNSYAAPKKDISMSAKTLRLTAEDGSEVAYEKGIGAHANSTIVYDLTDKDADYFTSFVGVDRQMYGTVGSVIFQVFVDGEMQFNSGLMNSRDPQKFVEVNISGAQELKLVVTDGGNGIGSDHATWGNAKLHFANADRVFIQDLVAAIEEAKTINSEDYTSESVADLQVSIAQAEETLANKKATQVDIDQAVEILTQAIDALVAIDFDQVITIQDNTLKIAIQQTLGLTDEITLRDMHNLTSLSSPGAHITSLDGLQHAKNLVSLDISGNSITDFSPLKELSKLDDINAHPQIVEVTSLTGPVLTVENLVKGLDGNYLNPYQIGLRHMKTGKEIFVEVDQLAPNAEQFTIDLSEEDSGIYMLVIAYTLKDEDLIQLMYFVDNPTLIQDEQSKSSEDISEVVPEEVMEQDEEVNEKLDEKE